MNDINLKILLFDEMIDAGVMPWEDSKHDMNKALSALPVEEQRKMRRKFRKLWRRHLRTLEAKFAPRLTDAEMRKIAPRLVKRFGVGTRPTKTQREARKVAVSASLLDNARTRAVQLKETGVDP